MNEEIKDQLIDGTLDPETARALLDAAAADPALAGELRGQAEISAALRILLDDEKADQISVKAALQRIRAASMAREPRHLLKKPWLLAAAAVSLMAAIAALMLPRQEESGLASSRFIEPSSVTPGGSPFGSSAAPVAPSLHPVLTRLAAADAAAMPALFADLLDQPPGLERVRTLEWAVLRWADLAPEAAVTTLLEKGSGESWLMGPLFDAWSRLDFESAWSAAEQLPEDGSRRLAKRAMLVRLAGNDPGKFVSLARSGQPVNGSDWVAAGAALAMNGPLNPDLSIFAGLTKDARRIALTAAADAFAARDPAAALVWARMIADPTDRRLAMQQSLIALAKSNPAAAGRELATMGGGTRGIASQIVRHLAQQEPARALDWARQFGGADTAALTRDLMLELVRGADSRALDVIAALAREGGAAAFGNKDSRLDDVFWQARGLDFAKGLSWVMKEAPRDAFGWDNLVRGMVFSWAKEDRAAADQWLTTNLPDPATRESVRSAIVFEMLSTTGDTGTAWQYNSERPSGPQRGRMALEILQRQAAIDPESAAAWLEHLPAEANRGAALGAIANQWGAKAPAEALEWATTLSAGERPAAVGAITAQWAAYDAGHAADWVNRQASGAVRDAATAALVGTVAPFQADSAFAWAITIGNGNLRGEVIEEVWRNWATQDPAAARTALGDQRLSTIDRQRASAGFNSANHKPKQ